ncbi:AAA family ATPase [Microbacterium deminutum]|uniref:AAA family ATPase n=1 Tax=Microbacterium deminutum TaxID=344164 RepID=A0ABN2QFA3_9MICO
MSAAEKTVEKRTVCATPFSLITPTRMQWVWAGKIPVGTVTANVGKGGIGKTTFELWQIARLTRGELEGDWAGRAITVLIVTPEDDPGAVTRPRLEAAGADLDRVFNLTVAAELGGATRERRMKLPLDMEQLGEVVTETGAQLVFIDGMTTAFEGSTDSKEDMRAALDPLIDLAQRRDIAVIVTHHSRKGNGNLTDLISGSHAIRDAVRSVLFFVRDEETGEVIITQDKSNYGAETASCKFRLVSATVETPDGQTEVGSVEWLGESDVSAADLIARTYSDGDADDRNAAQQFVLDYLHGREAWEANAGEVLKAGRAAGFSDNELKHARRRSRNPRIESTKSAFGGAWVWVIEAEGATEGAEGAMPTARGTFGTFVAPSTDPSERDAA